MPADSLSPTPFDEVTTILNVKAIGAAIDPFTPSLAEEEQAADPDMIKFRHFFEKILATRHLKVKQTSSLAFT